jgi:GTPase SAR1 family protein
MLDKLDFGRDDAESEKEFLERVFLPTKLFERVKTNKKWLVLGRKGSGKTAVCLTLLRQLQDEKSQVSYITPANFSIATNAMLNKGSVNTQEASMLSWKYVFLVELAKYIVEAVSQKDGKDYLKWSENAKQVREFLVSSESRYADWRDKARKTASEVSKVAIKVASVEASAERIKEDQEASALRDLLDDVTNAVAECVDKYFDKPIYILTDNVDDFWSSNPESGNLISGLLIAAKEIRSKINRANIVVFLRTDIFETLRFNNSDHFHVIEERLIWDEESLLRLIALRIRASVGGKSSAAQTWEKVFPKKIGRDNSFAYLLQFTLMRPRDLIQLCTECRDNAQNLNLKKIDKTAISEALLEYSRWKINDLRDEYRVQYPFLEKVFWGVFSHAPYRFDREALEARIKPYLSHLVSEFGEEPFKPLDNLLQALFNIGFIGAVKPGKVIYFYQGGQIIVPFTNEFVIHPSFRTTLQTTESLEHMKGIKVVKGTVNVGRDIVGGDKILSGNESSDSDPGHMPPPPAPPPL